MVESVKPAANAPGKPPYEIVSGTFSGELDPAGSHNRIITDLALAPRNARGLVEYRATFRIARPADPAAGSGVLFYDVPNRGTGMVKADADGHVRVISGWQGDLVAGPGVQSIAVPVARRADGGSITGPVLARFDKLAAGGGSIAITGGLGTPVARPLPVSLDTSLARLWRERRDGGRTLVPAAAWAFADCRTARFPGTPDPRQLCLRDGFDADAAYTLVYRGKDPLVLGIGFAATRDLVSFLRSGRADDAGHPNPGRGAIRWTVASGSSQSGNFLRSFVHLGFNADEAGARVFDGVNSDIAARLVPLNVRFGVPGGAAGVFDAGSEGTLWWGRYDDRARRRGPSSLLDRCRRAATCPKIVETLGSGEFWNLRASPMFVGTDAMADIALPPDVRRYYFPSVTHGGAFVTRFSSSGGSTYGQCVLRGNPNPSRPYLAAAQRALVDWVVSGKEPPPSRYPMLARGDLVAPTARAMGWPALPGAPLPDRKINPLPDQDFGPAFRYGDLSGVITRQPPRLGRIIPQLVPRVDADGNETAGVASVHLLAPLGSYTGWNVETRGVGKGGGCGLDGGFIPFARTRAERIETGDPRPSLEERYGDHAGFVARVKQVAAAQRAEGWLLAEDVDGLVAAAEASDVLRD